MLCVVCSNIDFDEATRLDGDRPGYPHHASVLDLYRSAQQGCELCNCIWTARPLQDHGYGQYSSRLPSQLWLSAYSHPGNLSTLTGPSLEYIDVRSHPGSLIVDWRPVFSSQIAVYAEEGK